MQLFVWFTLLFECDHTRLSEKRCTIFVALQLMKNTINLSRFKKLESIGDGSFGQVYRVEDKETKQIYAAKISKKSIKEKSRDERLNLKREVDTLSQLNRPSLLKFIGYSQKNFEGETKPVIITEYLSHGSLKDLIVSSKDPDSDIELDDTKKVIIIYGIASAMSYLHSKGLIHRDLKPANILMDDSLYPVIADFGLAKIIHNDDDKTEVTQSNAGAKGTPVYLAPEIMLQETEGKKIEYTKAVDVYAFSIIVYELFSKKPPFSNVTAFKLYDKVMKGERPQLTNEIPEPYRELIEKCWSQESVERPTFDEIVELLESEDFDKGDVELDEFNKYINYIKSKSLIYPSKKFDQLSSSCQKMVKQAETNSEIQFQVGQNLIEGKNGFPKNITIGTAYLSHSADSGYIKAIEYYCNMLIEGDVIDRDIGLVKNYLKPLLKTIEDTDKEKPMIYLLYGKAMVNKPNYQIAVKVFNMLFKMDLKKFNKEQKKVLGEAYFEFGKLIYEGKGKTQNIDKAMEYFEKAKSNGFKKVDEYISKMQDEEENENESIQVDIIFLVDGTFSMSFFIQSIHDNLEGISKEWTKKYPDISFMYGAIIYRDTCVTRLFQPRKRRIDQVDCYDLTDDVDEVINFLSDVKCCGGGGDGPEDWASGFDCLLNRITWRDDSIKIVFHVADAPGHGKQFTAKTGFKSRAYKVPILNPKLTLEQNRSLYYNEVQYKPNKYIFALICKLAAKKVLFFCMNGSDKAMQCFQSTKNLYEKKGGLKYVIMNQFNCSVFKNSKTKVDMDELNQNMKELALNAVDISIDLFNEDENEEEEEEEEEKNKIKLTDFEIDCISQFKDNLQEYESRARDSRSGMQSEDSVASFSSVNSNLSRSSSMNMFDFNSDFDDSDKDKDENDSDKDFEEIDSKKVDTDDDEEEDKNQTRIVYSKRPNNSSNESNTNRGRRPYRGYRRGNHFNSRRGRYNNSRRGHYYNYNNRSDKKVDDSNQENNSNEETNNCNSHNRGRNNYNNNRNINNYYNSNRGGQRRGGNANRISQKVDDDDSNQEINSDEETTNTLNNYNRERNNYNSNNNRRGGYNNNRGGQRRGGNANSQKVDDDDSNQEINSDKETNTRNNYNRGRNNYNSNNNRRGGYNNNNRGGQRRGGKANRNSQIVDDDDFEREYSYDDEVRANRNSNTQNRNRGGQRRDGNQNREGGQRGNSRRNINDDDSDDE